MPFNKVEALRKAEEHVSKGEITAAIAIHRMMAQADPYDLTTINALGELYVGAGRTKEAIDDFTRIADGYLNSGSGIKAAYLLRKALDLDPANAPALIKLAEIYLREGMVEKAHDEFVRAGALLAREGQLTGALQANHRALTAKPGSPQAKAAIAALQAAVSASETGPLGSQLKNGTQGLRNSARLDPSPARPSSGPIERLSSADEESLIRQLSKAEMLVGYGEVDEAIVLLKEVVNHSPDNLDVHGKLKDIYLRNEMIKEAGRECLELARIHEARGESARANEYAMRASRLAHSSGQLVNDPLAQTLFNDGRLDAHTVVSPSRSRETHSEARETEIQADHAAPELESLGSSSSLPPQTVDRPPIHREAELQSARVSPIVPLPATPQPVSRESELQPAGASLTGSSLDQSQPPTVSSGASGLAAKPRPRVHTQRPLAGRVPASLEQHVRETPLETLLHLEHTPNPAEAQPSANSFAVPSTLALTLSASATSPKGRSRWLYVAPMVLVGAIALTVGAIKGAGMYGAQLDKVYEELALSSSDAEGFSPPGLPSTEDLQPSVEREAVKIELPPVQIVTPTAPAAEAQIPGGQRSVTEPEPKAVPATVSEQPRVNKPAAASPPLVAMTDQKGGESFVPRGLPTGAPQTIEAVPSPPPSPPAPKRASAVVKGEVVKQVQPDYPAIARTARQEGAVPVEVSINENGDVVSARAISGPLLLRGSAEAAAKRWKFRPSTRDGKPLPTVTTINFRFKL